MKALLLGGTGALGTPLATLLSRNEYEVYITTRSERKDEGSIKYIKGNAHDNVFLNHLLVNDHYDVIIDFMIYSVAELEERLPILLGATNQYLFYSSSRVYANSSILLREDSPRLLDSCNDSSYLQTNEYALAKAREEDIIRNNNEKNWTIVRPYITYNTHRLQLGVYEKEQWLYRALHNRKVVFTKDIACRYTSFTFSEDVAKAVYLLIGNEKSLGEAFHIVNPEPITWNDVLNIYIREVRRIFNINLDIILIDDSEELQKHWGKYQILYDRLFDRRFDNEKINRTIGFELDFTPVSVGIKKCLEAFADNPKWLGLRPVYEAWADKTSNCKTPINEFNSLTDKMKYIKYRFFV